MAIETQGWEGVVYNYLSSSVVVTSMWAHRSADSPKPSLPPEPCTELHRALSLLPKPLQGPCTPAPSSDGLAFLLSPLLSRRCQSHSGLTWCVSLHPLCQGQPGTWRARLPAMLHPLLQLGPHSSQLAEEQAACGTLQGLGLSPPSQL